MTSRVLGFVPCLGLVRLAKTATYQVVGTDRGATIDCTSGTYDITFAAAATLGAGFHVAIYNSGAGTITLNPNGAETIRSPAGAATTLALIQGQGVILMCDGTGFDVVSDSGLAPSSGAVISGLTTGRIVDAASATTIETAATISTDQTLSTSSTIASKQSAAAGISLDHNSATGNFTGRISPANLTANRRWTLPDADFTLTGGGAIALGGFTLTVPATGTAVLLSWSQTITGAKTFSATAAFSDASIGWTSTSPVPFQVTASINGNSQGFLQNTSAGTSARAEYVARNNAAEDMSVGITGSAFTPTGVLTARASYLWGAGTGGVSILASDASGAIKLGIGASATERARLSSSGNLLIGATADTGLTGAGGLRVASTTSASSSIVGAIVVGDAATAASCVGIGGGNINAGGTLMVGGATLGKAGFKTTSDTTPNTITAFDARHVVVMPGTTNGIALSVNDSTGTGYITSLYPGSAWRPLTVQCSVFSVDSSGGGVMFGVGSGGLITCNNTTSASSATAGAVTIGNGVAATSVALGGGKIQTGDTITAGSTIIAPAATTSIASVRMPHGTAPSAPTNGDLWTTTAGLYARINGADVGPFATATASANITAWDAGTTTTITGTTTNPGKGTVAVDLIQYRRVGDSMEVRMVYRHTVAGTAGSGRYLFLIPGGQSIDTSKVTVVASGSELGEAWGSSTARISGTSSVGAVGFEDATHFYLHVPNGGGGPVPGSTYFPMSAAAVTFAANFTVPISGWTAP